MNIEKRGFQMNNTLDEMGFTRLNKTVFEANKSDIERLQKLAQKRIRMADFKNGKFVRGILRLFGKKPGKKFLIELLNKKDFSREKAIKNLAENKTVKEIVENYLGKKAALAGCGLWYSKPSGKELSKSQLFHFDHGVPRTRLKIFIPLKKVTREGGAFCFFDAMSSSKLREAIGPREKYLDDEVFSSIGEEQRIFHEGDVSDAMMVDTMRCLHQGSRIEKGNRLLIMLAFSNAEANKKFSNKFIGN